MKKSKLLTNQISPICKQPAPTLTLDGTINSSAFGALDKLNSTIISLYTDPNLHFADWEQANRYLSSKFTEKAIRVPVKKPVKSEVVENEDEIIND